MTQTLNEDDPGSIANAKILAEAAELSYLPASTGVPAFADRLGLHAELISVDNTQVYVAGDDANLVAAFRGTESPTTIEGLKDWLLTDAVNLLIVPTGRLGTDFIAAGVGARFHQGFLDALAEVWEPFQAKLEAELKENDRPLWLTGHSLGGALALLAGWLLQRKFVPITAIVTFGAPMVGNLDAAGAFDREFRGKIFRYVNPPDPIPRLPTRSLIASDYGHCQAERTYAAADAGLLSRFVAAASTGLLDDQAVEQLWVGIQSSVAAHLMDQYKALIERIETS